MSPRARLRPSPPVERRIDAAVLMVANELAPMTPTARGASVAALASALTRHRLDVTVVAPVPDDTPPVRWGLARRLRKLVVSRDGADRELTVYDGALPASRAALFLVDTGDDPELLCAAALELARVFARWPNVVHAADETTAPALRLAARPDGLPRPRTVLSLHGDALPVDAADADVIVAPSPQRARDLLAADASLADRLHGVLAGVDRTRFDPHRDTALPAPFSADDLAGKEACKRAFQQQVGLPRRPREPLVAAICDLSPGSGGDLVVAAAAELGSYRGQLVILATGGDDASASAARALADQHGTHIAARIGADDALVRQAYAGADFILDPGRLDGDAPGPLACWRYGAIPILAADSGLADTVVDFDEASGTGSALVFTERSGEAVAGALRRAAHVYASRAMPDLVARAMRFDLSWVATAAAYHDLYCP